MPVYRDRYWHPANFEAVDELAAAAKAENRTLISLAFGWLMHHCAIDCIIVGRFAHGATKGKPGGRDAGTARAGDFGRVRPGLEKITRRQSPVQPLT